MHWRTKPRDRALADLVSALFIATTVIAWAIWLLWGVR